MDYFELSNGAKIPCLGTGPSAVYRRMNDINYKWKWISDIPLIGRLLYRIIYIFKRQKVSRQWVDVLSESLKVGNRLIDYSNSYGDVRSGNYKEWNRQKRTLYSLKSI